MLTIISGIYFDGDVPVAVKTFIVLNFSHIFSTEAYVYLCFKTKVIGSPKRKAQIWNAVPIYEGRITTKGRYQMRKLCITLALALPLLVVKWIARQVLVGRPGMGISWLWLWMGLSAILWSLARLALSNLWWLLWWLSILSRLWVWL